jgi:hypothetical protein
MSQVEVKSWLFVHRKWGETERMPIPDKGFEESFRQYLFTNLSFDLESAAGDMGLGLSYDTLSCMPHELDVICVRDSDLFVFELKHYEVSDITKEIVFTFLGKIMDYYLKNIDILSKYSLTMLLVTTNRNVDDSIRKLCMTYGIKLIEPSLMTPCMIDHFARDLYQKIPERNTAFKAEVEELVNSISFLREGCDYSFSDIVRYENGSLEIELPLLTQVKPNETLIKIKECHSIFERVLQKWRVETN